MKPSGDSYEEMAGHLLRLSDRRLSQEERQIARDVLDCFSRNTIPSLRALRKIASIFDRELHSMPCCYLTTTKYSSEPMCRLKLENRIESKSKKCSYVESPRDCPEYRVQENST